MRNWSRDRLTWKGNRLCVGARKRPLVEIEPDASWPSMWRARHPDGSLSDIVNLTRARDAAMSLALHILQVEETRTGAAGTAIVALVVPDLTTATAVLPEVLAPSISTATATTGAAP